MNHSAIKVMFSCSLPVCSSDRKDARKQKEKERKKSLSKGRDRYTIVKGLAGGPDGVSFESVTKKKHFLRVRENNILIVEPYDDSEEYRKQSTYIPLQDMWYFGYIVFESLVEPAHFIRRCSDQLVLQKYENTPFFKEDASFKLTRKRCIACVKIGSRVWARIEKGCFLRGTVIAVDDLVHIELENGNRVKHKKITTEGDCAYVPDIVPHSLEIDIGTRVLARWFNRHDSYYPATVTAIRRNLFSVRYDDGDKGTNNINEIRILKQPEVEGGANLPSWSSLDGLPRVGGLCIDSTSSDQSTTEETIDSQETPQHEDWSPYPRDMSIPEQRLYENQSELPRELDRDADFGYENNLQYLTPNIQPLYHAPVIRNVSQVSGGSADSGYHDNACTGSTRQRRTGLWADLHCQRRATPAGNNSEKYSWEHEDNDPLSDNETSNSTNYSATNELDFPDSFSKENHSSFAPSHTKDHATGIAGHAKSNGGPNVTRPTKSYGNELVNNYSSTNGSYVTQNGESNDDSRASETKNYEMFAQNAEEGDRSAVPKAVPSKYCPIHHHGFKTDQLQSDSGRRKHHEFNNDAILEGECGPRLIGLETVI
ncbi:uncharacterized protein LOC116305738 isoform X3 [Actinia tenebrosa]|uniref:Uncharacterized protein LOC116305738 isoform X3 n=1 Tax=Actinia tenebrosa TaxID=6105 RepID=A0A6P8J190_ACTTE|nr:uncharacterized protein LOC116305738 isoform X3 [Actinia tenebrosa]